jgi:hypothetical protein
MGKQFDHRFGGLVAGGGEIFDRPNVLRNCSISALSASALKKAGPVGIWLS